MEISTADATNRRAALARANGPLQHSMLSAAINVSASVERGVCLLVQGIHARPVAAALSAGGLAFIAGYRLSSRRARRTVPRSI